MLLNKGLIDYAELLLTTAFGNHLRGLFLFEYKLYFQLESCQADGSFKVIVRISTLANADIERIKIYPNA